MNRVNMTYDSIMVVPAQQMRVDWSKPVEIRAQGFLDESLNCDWRDAEFFRKWGDKVIVVLNRRLLSETFAVVNKATGYNSMYDCDSGSTMIVEVRNKVKTQEATKPHPKNSIAVYFQRRDGLIQVYGWEGLKSNEEICSQFGKEAGEAYKKADIRAYGARCRYSNAPILCISTDSRLWYINPGDTLCEEDFFDRMRKLQRAAKNLSDIREKNKDTII